MPTYEYRCEECGNEFECYQSMKDDPLETCPKCSGSVKRLFGTGIFVSDTSKNCNRSSCSTCSDSG